MTSHSSTSSRHSPPGRGSTLSSVARHAHQPHALLVVEPWRTLAGHDA
ncbi:hypothetical protein DVA67_016060 [Solirubrobacter sp. CPCC 204708]|nr:hypothetical protein [Solirubrobacter deserti]